MTDNAEHHKNTKIIERRKELIMEARGKGGYIWNDKQLHNAMLWFTSDDADICRNKSDHRNTSKDLKIFLQSLLCNPGILSSRPLVVGKKRQRDDDDSPQGPLLPHILSLILIQSTEQDERYTGNLDISLEHTIAVLSAISNDRNIRTGELPQSTQQRWDYYDKNDEETPKLSWNYLMHPTTLTKSMYAAYLYSHYLELSMKKEQGNSGQALLFLKEMKALAGIKHSVAEAFLLMLLEPIKRQQTVQSHWLNALFSDGEITFHAPDSGCVEGRAYHILSKSVIETVTIQNIHKFSPALLCALGKMNFNFAKVCLEALVSCVLEIPQLVANYALQYLITPRVEDTCAMELKPYLIYDKCVSIAKEWRAIHESMAFLLRDVLNIRLKALRQDGNDEGAQVLHEFSRTIHA
jgi:hypothetical protein